MRICSVRENEQPLQKSYKTFPVVTSMRALHRSHGSSLAVCLFQEF